MFSVFHFHLPVITIRKECLKYITEVGPTESINSSLRGMGKRLHFVLPINFW